MKKAAALILSAVMATGLLSGTALAKEQTLTAADVSVKSESGVMVADDIAKWESGGYVGFKVDMTGVKSIHMTAESPAANWYNGEAFRIRLDDPKKGAMLGYMIVNRSDETEYNLNIKGSYSGEHTLYVVQNYHVAKLLSIKSIRLSDTPYQEEKRTPVDDSVIIDTYSDTWAATDSLGRRIANYSETGAVKEGTHSVGMFYWVNLPTGSPAIIASEVIAEDPSAKEDYYNKLWCTDKSTGIYWNEPLFGFYGSDDYWVFRRHAEMLSAAGVDFIMFDLTNGDRAYPEFGTLCFKAFGDARAEGLNVPKISFYTPMSSATDATWRMLKAIYLNYYSSGEYSDLWFCVDGKPLIVATEYDARFNRADTSDTDEATLVSEIKELFNVRSSGSKKVDPVTGKTIPGDDSKKEWKWLESYPQVERYLKDNGRYEFMSLGTALNESYETGAGVTGAFSDPYAKGRAYTEAFGEDYRTEAAKEGYFMQEQISRVLAVDPEYVFVTGWNEWQTARSQEHGGKTNVFIDLYDDENSRDIEPTKGALGDDYYNLLSDFVRKYKGVRPVRTARGAKTIDINADASAWEDVMPYFANNRSTYERDSYDNYDRKTGGKFHYVAKVKNAIVGAKASFDDENIYFMLKTDSQIKDGDNFMQIYVNSDRNYATGWEGYDYLIEKGTVYALSKDFNKTETAKGAYTVSGNVMQVKVPRSALGETGTVDFEFKAADGINVSGNVLNFYVEGSSAPIGRFSFVYTDIPEKALTTEERAALGESSLLSDGSADMIARGGKMKVYDPDTRVTTFSENGTLYIPAYALSDIMGYGETKTEYGTAGANVFMIKNHTTDGLNISGSTWMWTVVGSLEARVDGKYKALSNPVKEKDGIVYVPASLLSECFGYEAVNLDGGLWFIGKDKADTAALSALSYHFE